MMQELFKNFGRPCLKMGAFVWEQRDMTNPFGTPLHSGGSNQNVVFEFVVRNFTATNFESLSRAKKLVF